MTGVVWRVTVDADGTRTVTVAEVWAVGARSNAEVYAEMTGRVAAVGQHPPNVGLAQVIELLGRHAVRNDIAAAVVPVRDVVPTWLRDRLVHSAGIDPDSVATITGTEAMERWDQFMITGR